MLNIIIFLCRIGIVRHRRMQLKMIQRQLLQIHPLLGMIQMLPFWVIAFSAYMYKCNMCCIRSQKSKHKASGDTANASDYMESKRRKRQKKDNLEISNIRGKSMTRSQSNLKGSRRARISFNAKLPKAQLNNASSNTWKRKIEHGNLPKVEATLNSHGMSRKFSRKKGTAWKRQKK